jgi:hypothetical protein
VAQEVVMIERRSDEEGHIDRYMGEYFAQRTPRAHCAKYDYRLMQVIGSYIPGRKLDSNRLSTVARNGRPLVFSAHGTCLSAPSRRRLLERRSALPKIASTSQCSTISLDTLNR